MTDLYEFAIDEFVNAFHTKGKRVFKEAFYDSDSSFWKHVLVALGFSKEDLDTYNTFKDFSFNTLYSIMQDKLKPKKNMKCMGPGRPRPIYKLWMSSKGEPDFLIKLGKYYKDDKIKLCTILQKVWDLKYEDGYTGKVLLKKCKKFIKSYARINLVGSLLKCLLHFCEIEHDSEETEPIEPLDTAAEATADAKGTAEATDSEGTAKGTEGAEVADEADALKDKSEAELSI